jgi:peptidylprolyl isomerase
MQVLAFLIVFVGVLVSFDAAAGEFPVVVGQTVTTASGLQYADIRVGQGPIAQQGSNVSVHYTGWLADNTRFDSSVERGRPFEFQIGQGRVIKGWEEGVASMRVGGVRQLIIPPDLAYGGRARGPIPENATLTFEIELLEIKSPRVAPEHPTAIGEHDYNVTQNGVKYNDIGYGSGEILLSKTATVTVEYTGWFVDGTRFDSSLSRAGPATFSLNQVIPGWSEGMLGMQVGGKRQVWIPYELAYGERGRPPTIPARMSLIFEIELIKIAH